jgi:hypothetical protein
VKLLFTITFKVILCNFEKQHIAVECPFQRSNASINDGALICSFNKSVVYDVSRKVQRLDNGMCLWSLDAFLECIFTCLPLQASRSVSLPTRNGNIRPYVDTRLQTVVLAHILRPHRKNTLPYAINCSLPSGEERPFQKENLILLCSHF